MHHVLPELTEDYSLMWEYIGLNEVLNNTIPQNLQKDFFFFFFDIPHTTSTVFT